MAGAFFSLLSLVVDHEFDLLGGIMYVICIALEVGIFTSHFVYLVMRRIRKRRGLEDDKNTKEDGGDVPGTPASRDDSQVDLEAGAGSSSETNEEKCERKGNSTEDQTQKEEEEEQHTVRAGVGSNIETKISSNPDDSR